MKSSDLIYFDQAATSYPKPKPVKKAFLQAMKRAGGNAGRSAHRLALAASEVIYEGREAVSDLVDAPCPEGVVFTAGATAALNLAMHVLTRDGGHVLYSDMEHNAVYRPLCHLAEMGKIRIESYASHAPLDDLEQKVRPDTRLVIANHASNVTGRVMPIEKIGLFCEEKGIAFLVDASQSLGHLPVSMEKMKIDLLCAPAHKSLYGLMGVGMAVFRYPKEDLPPFLLGGSGSNSFSPHMPHALPEHFEAGTLPSPLIAALTAAIKETQKREVTEIEQHILTLEKRLHMLLAETKGICLLHPEEYGSGSLSFTHERLSPAFLGELLDKEGFAVRSGYHCAPLAHLAFGTAQSGTVRISIGRTNTLKECDRFYRALRHILK